MSNVISAAVHLENKCAMDSFLNAEDEYLKMTGQQYADKTRNGHTNCNVGNTDNVVKLKTWRDSRNKKEN